MPLGESPRNDQRAESGRGNSAKAIENSFSTLARRTLRSSTSDRDLPESPPNSIPAACRAARGCFVTLTKDGQLRGCIGNILPADPLFQAVEDNARNAALRDFAFSAR